MAEGIREFLSAVGLLFVLVNPFLMSVYLIDLIEDLDRATFARVVARGFAFAGLVFIGFSVVGDALFTDILQTRFFSFLVFGGIVFLLVGIRFALDGNRALRALRGAPGHVSGSIAMPFVIGPATVSASILIGGRLSTHVAAAGAIVVALGMGASTVILFKWLHDWVRTRNEALVERYTDLTGRVVALVVGTYAVDMILNGLQGWLREVFPS